MKKEMERWVPMIVIFSIILMWELVVRIGEIPLYVLPGPSQILKALVTDYIGLSQHALVTLVEALSGIMIALILGLLLGIGMDAFPLLKKSIYPILVVTQTVPMVVLSPIFIIYLGFGIVPKILIVVLMCFFPIVISFSDQMSQLNQSFTYLIKSYGGGEKHIYLLAKIPAALPALFSGLKVAATYSIGGAVVGEWIASQSGLGYYLIRVKNAYMLDKVFACVVVIIVLSLGMNVLVSGCEKLLVRQVRRQSNNNKIRTE